MKRLMILLLAAGVCFGTTWYQVRVPVYAAEIPEVLYGFEITDAEPGQWVEVVCTDSGLRELDKAAITYEIVVEDMEAYFASLMSDESNFGAYYTFSEALAIMDSLHQAYPHIISEAIVLPNDVDDETFMGNHVYAFKVSDNVGTEEDEPEALFTGLHHAREPICVNVTVEWARWLCEGYGTDPVATYLVEERQIWIIPVLNPDGYLYNEENAPQGGGMHRKNMKSTSQVNPGVDLNRNYPYMWGYDDQGSSPNPDMDTYRGPSPGSEEETQSIMNLCKQHQFVTCVNFHSHSNLFLYPWGYADVVCVDSFELFHWGEVATRGCHYEVTPGSGLYPTNGDTDDWMYGEMEEKNRVFSATIEVGEWFWQEQEIPQHIKETRPLLIATAQAAGVYPVVEALTVSDGGDGLISPGETVDITLGVHNMSVRDPSGDLSLELASDDPRVELLKGSATIPSIPAQHKGNNLADPLQVKLSESVQPDSAIPLTLTLTTASEEYAYDIALPVGEKKVLTADDFEAGCDAAAWSGEWGVTSEKAHSGENCATDSPYSSYPDDQASYMVSPKMDLSQELTAELSFWQQYSIRRKHFDEVGQDWGVLEVTHDGLDEWVTLVRINGSRSEWEEVVLNLDSYCGTKDFQVRFGIVADVDLHLDGWYVDDVEVSAYSGALSEPGAICELAEVRPVAGPAPTVTRGQVDFAGTPGLDVKVSVFDESGRLVKQATGKIPFGLEMQDQHGTRLPAGAYFIHTSYDRGKNVRKLIVVD